MESPFYENVFFIIIVMVLPLAISLIIKNFFNKNTFFPLAYFSIGLNFQLIFLPYRWSSKEVYTIDFAGYLPIWNILWNNISWRELRLSMYLLFIITIFIYQLQPNSLISKIDFIENIILKRLLLGISCILIYIVPLYLALH